MNFDGTTDDALGQRVVVFKIVHRVLRVLCVSVSSVFKQTRRLRSCMTSSRAVGRCVRHRGHRDTEDTEEFRDFASTTLPTTVLRLRRVHLFVYTLSEAVRLSPPDRRLASERADCAAQFHRCFASSAQPISTTPLLSTTTLR